MVCALVVFYLGYLARGLRIEQTTISLAPERGAGIKPQSG